MKAEHVLKYEIAGRPLLYFQRLRDERRIAAYRPGPDDALNPMLRCTARMKELMARHYLEGRTVSGVKPVAWVTSGAPTEILEALGYFLIYPENHAALCGTRRRAEDCCKEAEAAGYSRDICSYARTDIGTALGAATPAGRLPKPDLLVCCTNICQTVLLWYRVLAEHFGCPLVLIDTPFLYGPAERHQVEYVKRQIEDELLPAAERVAGRRMDERRLESVTREAKAASELWLEILNRSRTRPAPMTAFDGFLHMGPIVDMRGRPETTAYYELMLRELDDRVERGIGAVRDERYRVLWDNLPIWFRIGRLSKMLAAHGVNIVVSTYTYAWGELAPLIDPADPLESGANVYLHAILNRSTGDKLATMQRLAEEFSIDGVILHSNRSCKPYSIGQIDQRDRLVAAGVPALLLEADHSDPRAYADEQGTTRIEAFLEMMEAA